MQQPVSRYSFDRLLDDLEVAPGSVVMLLSSFSRLEHFGLSGPALISTLRRRLLPRGTLLMPSYVVGAPGRRIWESYASYFSARPIFDVRNDPAHVGYLPELFRRLPGTRRSMRYMMTIAAEGALARELTEGQENVPRPAGAGSSIALANAAGATVLGLGVTLGTTALCLEVDDLLGDRHPAPVFTAEPQLGRVRDWEGRVRETWSYFVLPRASRYMQPARVFEESAALRNTVRRRDVNGSIHFAYPAASYTVAALALADAALAAGRPLPWLERYADASNPD